MSEKNCACLNKTVILSETWQVGVIRWLTRVQRSTTRKMFSHAHIWMQHSRSSELDQILYYYVAPAAMSGVSTPVSIGFSLELTALRLVPNRNVS